MSNFETGYTVDADVFVDPNGQKFVSFGVGLEVNPEDTAKIGEKYSLSVEELTRAHNGLVAETEQYTDLKSTGETVRIEAGSEFRVDKTITDDREDFLQRLLGLNVHYLMKI